MKRVAILMGVADDKTGQTRVAFFQQGLRELGWEEGRNVRFDVRWGAGDAARARDFAKELVELRPDLIHSAQFAAVHESVCGPSRHFACAYSSGRFWGEADMK
jgi:hypothetical protein